MENFTKSCISSYKICPTSNENKKYRCFLINDIIPTEDIMIKELYQAKDEPRIKIIYAENSVRIHLKRLGQGKWIPIKKESCWRSNFIRLETPYETEIKNMKKEVERLRNEKSQLECECAWYKHSLATSMM